MPQITLRTVADQSSPNDIQVSVQDKTFEYLMTSTAEEIRVSAYLDQDIENVEAEYEELFVNDDCKFKSMITKMIPGSRTRQNIKLPAAMKSGEQLVILVERSEI